MSQLHAIIVITSTLSPILPFLAGAYTFPRLTRPMRILWVLLLFTASLEIVVILYFRKQGITNTWLYLIYAVLEYWFIIWVLSYWQNSRQLKRVFIWSIPFFALATFGIQIAAGFGSYYIQIIAIHFFLILITGIYTLVSQQNFAGVLYRDHRFWTILGVIVLGTGGTLVYGMAAFTSLEFLWQAYYLVFSGMNILSYLFFTTGFFLCR